MRKWPVCLPHTLVEQGFRNYFLILPAEEKSNWDEQKQGWLFHVPGWLEYKGAGVEQRESRQTCCSTEGCVSFLLVKPQQSSLMPHTWPTSNDIFGKASCLGSIMKSSLLSPSTEILRWQPFTCEWVAHTIYSYKVIPRGAGEWITFAEFSR